MFQYLSSCSALVVAAVSFHPSEALAQWSADAANNLVIADAGGGSTQPKMVPAPEGGFYVSWFGNDGGFDIHLQRLDADGNALWPHNGIVVADRDYGFTYDYGLAVDGAGNALISFNCCQNNTSDERIVVSKIAPDGTLPWGPTGVVVSSAAERVYNAYVTPTSDGDIVVAWSADSGVRAQKLDASGDPSWTAGGIVLTQPPSALKLLGGVQPAEDGNAIVSFSNQAGSARILYAQKLASADGASLWGNGVRVFGEGNLQAGYYPPFLADEAGGGVFWDYDIIGSRLFARVQRIDAAGNLMLGVNGVLATTDTANKHTDTKATFDPQTGDIYVIWRENFTDAQLQTYDGLSAQRIDTAGNRLWGDTGKVVVPLTWTTDGSQSISQLVALPSPGGFLASWVTGSIPRADQPITVARYDTSGAPVWPTQTVQVKSRRHTARTVAAVSHRGFAAFAWQDGDDDAGASTIRAQNIGFDGSLGAPVGTTYAVGGTVDGLAGSGLVLRINGGGDLAIGSDGSFAFPTELADGSTYAVSVHAQPIEPPQTCTVSHGNGTIAAADVTDVVVTCSEPGSDAVFVDGFETR